MIITTDEEARVLNLIENTRDYGGCVFASPVSSTVLASDTPERVDLVLQETWAYRFLERTHRRGITAKVAPEAEFLSARSRFLERISSARVQGAIQPVEL